VQEKIPQLCRQYEILQSIKPPIFFTRLRVNDLFSKTGRKWIERLTGATQVQIQEWYDKFWDLFAAHDRGCLSKVMQYEARRIPFHPEVQREYEDGAGKVIVY